MGADIPRSTLIDWCGQAVATLRPLTDLIRTRVMRLDRLHADDTPIRVLDPERRAAQGKTRGVKEGRIWVYLRDDRPRGGSDPPAATYFFSPDRRGERPQEHLAGYTTKDSVSPPADGWLRGRVSISTGTAVSPTVCS
ncbi:hypothetical protein GGE65_007910 [Skermanella aerolata]